jgi:hypothetical protein
MRIDNASTLKVANLIIPANFPAYDNSELTPIEHRLLKTRLADMNPISRSKIEIIEHVAKARHIERPSHYYWRVMLAWWHCADMILDVLLDAAGRKRHEWVLIPAITSADAEHYELYGAPRSVYATVYPTSKGRWAYDIEIEQLYALTSQSVYATPQEAMAVAEPLLAPHLRYASEEAQMKLNAVGLINPADLEDAPTLKPTEPTPGVTWKKTKRGMVQITQSSSKSKMAQPVAAAL